MKEPRPTAESLAVVLVAAVADNGVIGSGGGLPWRLSTDLRRFRSITTGHPVVMGRKTWLAIGKPLKERTNIVISRNPAFAAAGIVAVPSVEAALAVAKGDALRRGVAAIMVIGGAEIYAQAWDLATRLDITCVHMRPRGDALFPQIAKVEWRETNRRDVPAGPGDEAPFTIMTYERTSG